MGLIILRGRNGEIRPTWYGRITHKRKAFEKNLGVSIAGNVPMDITGKILLSVTGDDEFEKSRKAAQRALDKWRKETRKNPAELQMSAYKALTGVSMSGVPLVQLIDKWIGLKRQHQPTPERTRNARLTFKRFADFARRFAASNGNHCDTLNDVTPEMVAAWFESIKSEYAWGTVKDMMHLLSGAFKRWATNGQPNPFNDILLRGNKAAGEEKKRIERKALTPEQFARLLSVAHDDARFYPLIVCAAFTGMRLGDVCRLKVSDVDLPGGEIDCVTAKAGVRVRIPIISDALREVLEVHCAIPADGSQPSPFVFPWAAAQYGRNRTAIVRGVKPYFARAVHGDAPAAEDAELIEADEHKERKPPDIEAAAAQTGWSEQKRKRVTEIYRRFKSGEQSRAIAEALGIARGQVSNYLKDAERITGERLRPRTDPNAKPAMLDLVESTRVKRTVGKYSASIWGWHNLRHHFITCALNNGVPLYKVSAIVGHKTTEMTEGYADTLTDTRNKLNDAISDCPHKQMGKPKLKTAGRLPMKSGVAMLSVAQSKTTAERLRELKALADEGLISSSEYTAQRNVIISGV